MLDVRMIERGLTKPGKTKGGLAMAMGVRPGAVSEILAEIRQIKATEIEPIIVNLTSFNAKPINSVKLEWIGEICVTLPRGQIERLRAKAAARARRAAKSHVERQTDK